MKVILGVSGSIAAVESVHICTELRRFGHEVSVVMSDFAQKIVHPYALQLTSDREVITELTGKAEHVKLVEESQTMLIAPCTANTISKIALGIGDNALTTTALTALGKIPLVIAPAMHLSLLENPAVKENIEKLKNFGVKVIPPVIEEGRAKMYGKRCAHIFLHMVSNELRGKKIAVIGGSGVEHIDDIRVITNLATGRTALEIAKLTYILGGDVVLYAGTMHVEIPDYIPTKKFSSLNELLALAEEMKSADIIFVPAALPDYMPSEKFDGKIKKDSFSIHFVRTKRFLEKIREINPSAFIVGFKAEYSVREEDLISSAKELMEKYSLNLVVANDFRFVDEEKTKCFVVSKDSVEKFEGGKKELAKLLVEKAMKYEKNK